MNTSSTKIAEAVRDIHHGSGGIAEPLGTVREETEGVGRTTNQPAHTIVDKARRTGERVVQTKYFNVVRRLENRPSLVLAGVLLLGYLSGRLMHGMSRIRADREYPYNPTVTTYASTNQPSLDVSNRKARQHAGGRLQRGRERVSGMVGQGKAAVVAVAQKVIHVSMQRLMDEIRGVSSKMHRAGHNRRRP